MFDSFGDGWNGAEFTAPGWTDMAFSMASGDYAEAEFTASMESSSPPPPPPPPVPCSAPDAAWPMAPVSVSPGSFSSEVSWKLSCEGMCDPIEGGAPYEKDHRVPPGAACTLEMMDSFGDGWNGAVWWSGFSDAAGYELSVGSIESMTFVANLEPSVAQVTGECVVNGPCVCSSNFVDSCNADPVDESTTPQYGSFESCDVSFAQAMMLSVSLFDVEQGDGCPFDALEVDGVSYCGGQPEGLDGVVTSTFTWRSDGSVTGAGFKICASTAPPAPPSPPDAWLNGVMCPFGSYSNPWASFEPSPSPGPWGPSPSPSPSPEPSPGSWAGMPLMASSPQSPGGPGRRLSHDGMIFDGPYPRDKEDAKEECADMCIYANQMADMYGGPRCAYAELYYDDDATSPWASCYL